MPVLALRHAVSMMMSKDFIMISNHPSRKGLSASLIETSQDMKSLVFRI